MAYPTPPGKVRHILFMSSATLNTTSRSLTQEDESFINELPTAFSSPASGGIGMDQTRSTILVNSQGFVQTIITNSM